MAASNIQIKYKAVKNISIRVKSNLEVVITAPLGTPKTKIEQIINLRRDWINKHLSKFAERQLDKERNSSSNDVLEYLGKSYPLKLVTANHESINLVDGVIMIMLKDIGNKEAQQDLIENWYYTQAYSVFAKLILELQPLVNKPVQHLSIKKMTTRWGSCNHHKGYINLNLELIKKPLIAIEYVILHELTHLIYPNHSAQFYAYIARFMPDWQERTKLLRNYSLD